MYGYIGRDTNMMTPPKKTPDNYKADHIFPIELQSLNFLAHSLIPNPV